jgi:hypothetical protein
LCGIKLIFTLNKNQQKMGATNESSHTAKRQFFQLREEKVNDKGTGEIRFNKQGKVDDKWQVVEKFKNLSGYITELSIESYDYQGKPKENLIIKMLDNDDTSSSMEVSLGFTTILARNILNTLAGEEKLGLISFSCGNPNIYDGKLFPTLWVNNDGEKTSWKYTRANGNTHLIPAVTTTTDADGNNIKKGVAAAAAFWKQEIELINKKIDVSSYPVVSGSSTNEAKNYAAAPQSMPQSDRPMDMGGYIDDLPF